MKEFNDRVWNWVIIAIVVCLTLSLLSASLKFLSGVFWQETIAEDGAVREFFEFTYYISNSLLVVVAGVPLLVARNQVVEAVHARKASIFLEIEARWTSEKMENSRRELIEIYDEWKNSDEPRGSAGNYVKERVENMSYENVQSITAILVFFEYLGYMIKKEYIDEEDIDNFLRSTIIFVVDLFGDYIASRRLQYKRIYLNASELADRMKVRQAEDTVENTR